MDPVQVMLWALAVLVVVVVLAVVAVIVIGLVRAFAKPKRDGVVYSGGDRDR